MDFKLFKKIINELKEKKFSGDISPFFVGEPLLVPNIFEYLRYMRHNIPKAHIMLFSNASKLTPEISRTIIEEQLCNKLVISFDGGDKKTYEAIRVGLSFDKVRKNIHEFIKIRNELGMKTPLVEVSMVVTPSNRNTTKKMESEFKDADAVTFHKYFEASVPESSKWIYSPKTRKSSRINNFINKRNSCYYLDSLMILSNGVVANCCADYEGLYPVGDCNKQTIEQIWNGKILKQRREDLRNRHFEKLPFCANCDEIDQNIVLRQFVKTWKFFIKFPRIYKVLLAIYAKYF